jgi:hypothetical protein
MQVEERRPVSDPKAARKVANNSLHNALAKTGELIFISILVGLIVVIFFLGIFFTFYHS